MTTTESDMEFQVYVEDSLMDLIELIQNKKRKEINEWKHEFEFHSGSKPLNDIDVIDFHVTAMNLVPVFMNYITCDNLDNNIRINLKWKSTQSRLEFFNDIQSIIA